MSDRPDVDVDAIARRSFLKRMAAALALAGTSGGCTRAPSGMILPYVAQPPEVQPGNPRWYASALALDGYAQGVLVASREGRPVKIEGNPDHPASLGAAGPFEQASVLGLYDPDRARGVLHRRDPSTWTRAVAAIANRPWRQLRGRGLTIVLEPTGSLLVGSLLGRLRDAFPEIDVRYASAAPRTPTWDATRAAFGRVLEPRYHLDRADLVVVLDADILAAGPAWLRWARQFADRRRSPKDGMSRAYVVEPRLTPTGASADHRLAVRRSHVATIAAALLGEIGHGVQKADALPPDQARFVRALAKDLLAHRGRGIVIAGDTQPAEVHVLAYAIDAALGNLGQTKTFGESPLLGAGPSHDLAPLASALQAGQIDALVVVGPNLAYTHPSLDLARAGESLYLGEYDDETARACTWSAALAHPLESWGDARAFDGTRSIVQPLVAPLHDGRSVPQLLAALLGELDADPYGMTRRVFRDALGAPFEDSWRDALVRGVVPDSATPDVDVTFRREAIRAVPAPQDALELAFDLDRRVHDGRFTNVAWLAEVPEPLTTLSWGNAVLVSEATAKKLGVDTEHVVELAAFGRTLRAPVLVAHGQADDQLTLTLGWGRIGSLSVAGNHGANAYALRGAPWSAPVRVNATNDTQPLAIVQRHKELHGRDEEIAPHGTLVELRERGRIGRAPKDRPVALYANRPSAARQWGMIVDLNACTGCNACVVACQAENNVPTVGFANVRKGREMLWLRIDAYHDEQGTTRQPMLCQHCEQAPCEYVCPVGATTHSPDGINEMTYNRCVGTRFCSNNCPYKVRRFNWFEFHEGEAAIESLVHNPDVTVRGRGVMEKCTYCVQRIRRAEIHAKVEQRELRERDVVTACQQACPTNAIVFGDIADPSSEVSRLRADESRLYAVLDELGTVPRTRYLARVTNPNPELA